LGTIQSPLLAKLASALPLYVDLDKTLLCIDPLCESLMAALKHHWGLVLLLPFWRLRGRAHRKRRLTSAASLDLTALPDSRDLLIWLMGKHHRGRTLVPATGRDLRLAEVVADHRGIFDQVLASDGCQDLTGEGKARRFELEFEPAGFDYAGGSRADIPIWVLAHKSSARKSMGIAA